MALLYALRNFLASLALVYLPLSFSNKSEASRDKLVLIIMFVLSLYDAALLTILDASQNNFAARLASFSISELAPQPIRIVHKINVITTFILFELIV